MMETNIELRTFCEASLDIAVQNLRPAHPTPEKSYRKVCSPSVLEEAATPQLAFSSRVSKNSFSEMLLVIFLFISRLLHRMKAYFY